MCIRDRYYDANEEAIASIRVIVEEHELDCGLCEKDSVVYCMSVDLSLIHISGILLRYFFRRRI